MRFLLGFVCAFLCNSAQAQDAVPNTPQPPAERRDPTAPSAEILERLSAVAPTVDAIPSDPVVLVPADQVVEVTPTYPDFVLKGLVLSDPDHGTALLEAAGRRVTVQLAREPADSTTLPAPHASRLSGFSIQGMEFQVLDFSERRLLLQAPDRTILVQ